MLPGGEESSIETNVIGDFIEPEMLRDAIMAIEGDYPPAYDYSVTYEGGKMALFVQYKEHGIRIEHLVLFPWWGGAVVTGSRPL